MKALILIILALLGIILLLVVLLGAAYAAIIAYHEAQWKKIKSEKYEQHNRASHAKADR